MHPKTIAYLDCPAGISGDMTLGALVDAGVDLTQLVTILRGLPIGEWQMTAHAVRKQGEPATQMEITFPPQDHHRYLPQIEAIILEAGLPGPAEQFALAAFRRLAAAEAKIFGCSLEEVRFHEKGAMDTILDLCGAAVGFYLLGVEAVYAAPLPLYHGLRRHSRRPVPLPSSPVLELLTGTQVRPTPLEAELITATGAAIYQTALALSPQEEAPAFRLLHTGRGAGEQELPFANVLRLCLGQITVPAGWDLLTAVIDDDPAALDQVHQQAQALRLNGPYWRPLLLPGDAVSWDLDLYAPPGQGWTAQQQVFAKLRSQGARIRRREQLPVAGAVATLTTPAGAVKAVWHGEPGREKALLPSTLAADAYRHALRELPHHLPQPD